MGINLRNEPISEMGMCEMVYNDCYVKDGQAMYRNYSVDISARDLIRAAYKAKNEDMPLEFWLEDKAFDEFMMDNLLFGINTFDGAMAILYQQIWSKAEMRQVLLKISGIYDITAFV